MLEGALDASGDDLDSAIKSLNNLRLESTEAILSATGCKSENGLPTAVYPSVEGSAFNQKLFISRICAYNSHALVLLAFVTLKF